MNKDAKTRVVVIRNGIAKELHNLPSEIMELLEESYDEAPIKGLSRETYLALADFFEDKLVNYREELSQLEAENFGLFAKTVAFANAFDIYQDESPALFDMMLMIERSMDEHQNFNSKDISIRNLKNLIGLEWKDANKDFHCWARRLFEDTGLKIGIIRMSKFFYGVASANA